MLSSFGACLEASTQELTRVLAPHDFGPMARRLNGPGYSREWQRVRPWKTDVVQIVYRRGGERRVFVNVAVRLPAVLDGEGGPLVYDARGLTTPRVPVLFGEVRASAYARRLVRIVAAELLWFERFATPQQCLEQLTAPDRNAAATGPAVERAVQYLRSL